MRRVDSGPALMINAPGAVVTPETLQHLYPLFIRPKINFVDEKWARPAECGSQSAQKLDALLMAAAEKKTRPEIAGGVSVPIRRRARFGLRYMVKCFAGAANSTAI